MINTTQPFRDSTGRFKAGMPNYNPIKDRTGQKYGKLTFIKRVDVINKYNKPSWLCKCDCGNMINGVAFHSIKYCGKCPINRVGNLKHGMCETPTHNTWMSMRGRCTNINNKKYPRYGGRGISICEEWKKFINFYKDMGEKPRGHSIDRIDNNKGYYKENCRWATPKQQSNNREMMSSIEKNKRTNKKIEYYKNIINNLKNKLIRINGEVV